MAHASHKKASCPGGKMPSILFFLSSSTPTVAVNECFPPSKNNNKGHAPLSRNIAPALAARKTQMNGLVFGKASSVLVVASADSGGSSLMERKTGRKKALTLPGWSSLLTSEATKRSEPSQRRVASWPTFFFSLIFSHVSAEGPVSQRESGVGPATVCYKIR